MAEEKVSLQLDYVMGIHGISREAQCSMNSGGFVELLNSALNSFLEFALISTIHNARCPVDQNN